MKMQDLKKFDKQTNENRKMTLAQREIELEKVAYKEIMGLKVKTSQGDWKASKIRREIHVLKARIY